MRYQITLWLYDNDEVAKKVECAFETHWQAIALFDIVTRGVSGYYEAWLIDQQELRGMQYSRVLRECVGG